MKRLTTMFRRRLILKLYGYQILLFAGVVGANVLFARLVLEPAMQHQRADAIAWIAERVLDARDDAGLAQRRAADTRDRMLVNVTLFTPEGSVIANAAPRLPSPLDQDMVARLTREENIALSARTFAVAAKDGPRLRAYAIATWEPWFSWSRLIQVVPIILVVLAVGSLFLRRVIARPLERLSEVTHAFGLGDLRVRAETTRLDEIGDLARSFNEMANRVEVLRRAEKELLANVSHELRTPLARIRVVLELAEEEDPEVAKRYLADVAEDLTEMEQILGDIIATARLDLANERSADPYPPLRRTPVALHDLVTAIVRRLHDRHPERVVHCDVELCGTASVDRVMLKHAISNILDNAHKYSPIEQPIEVKLRTEGGSAEITIQDHGSGMTEEDASYAFTAFFRADRSRARATGGVGLGLTLAKRIAVAHGGDIDLKTRTGEGTTVTMRIPTQALLDMSS
jgi:two-component system OmpR family sensor kinase